MAPIHEALRQDDVEALRRELERGVDPDLRDPANGNRTPLQLLPYLLYLATDSIDAGGWANYERLHLDRLTAMLTPKDHTDERRRSRRRLSPLRRLPPEVLRKIAAFAFHAGFY